MWDAVRIRTRIPADPNGSQPDSISLLTDEAGGVVQDMALLYGTEPDEAAREEVVS